MNIKSLAISVMTFAVLSFSTGHMTSAHAGSRTFQFGGPLPSFTATRHGNSAGNTRYRSHKRQAVKKAKIKSAAKRKAAQKRKAAAKRQAIAKRKAIAKQKTLAKQKQIAAHKKAVAKQKSKARAKAIAAKKRATRLAIAARAQKAKTQPLADEALPPKVLPPEALPPQPSRTRVAPSTTAVLTELDISANSQTQAQTAKLVANPDLQSTKNETVDPVRSEPTANADAAALQRAEKPSQSVKTTANAAPATANTPEQSCKRYIPAVGLTISVGC